MLKSLDLGFAIVYNVLKVRVPNHFIEPDLALKDLDLQTSELESLRQQLHQTAMTRGFTKPLENVAKLRLDDTVRQLATTLSLDLPGNSPTEDP